AEREPRDPLHRPDDPGAGDGDRHDHHELPDHSHEDSSRTPRGRAQRARPRRYGPPGPASSPPGGHLEVALTGDRSRTGPAVGPVRPGYPGSPRRRRRATTIVTPPATSTIASPTREPTCDPVAASPPGRPEPAPSEPVPAPSAGRTSSSVHR